MPTTPALQTQIEAIQARIDALAPDASSEDIVMLAKAVEAVGGQTTVFDVIEEANSQKTSIASVAATKIAEVTGEGDTQVARVTAQGDAKHAELSAELEQHAAFTGASDDTDGALGMVPAPLAGDEHAFLRGDGDWRAPGEVPIGGIALLYPEMAGSRYLPAEGGTVLIADYPELHEVLGQAPTSMPTPSAGSQVLSESPGYSNYRAAAVNGQRVVIVRENSYGIEWSANSGGNWANAQIGSIGFQGPFHPALSDSGRTVGWLNYDSAPSPSQMRFQATTAAAFGAWSNYLNLGSDRFSYNWDNLVIGLPNGVAALGESYTNTDQILFQYFGDGDTGITREVNLTTEIPLRQDRCRLPVGSFV